MRLRNDDTHHVTKKDDNIHSMEQDGIRYGVEIGEKNMCWEER